MRAPRKSADQWFAEYGESHHDHANETIHWICVPVIFFSVMGLLWSLPVPAALVTAVPWFKWLHLPLLAALVFYFRLSGSLAFGLLGFISICYVLLECQSILGLFPIWKSSAILFVLAWIGQFIGHQIEGRKPSFFKDVVFLLIGPAWLMHFVYKKLDIAY
ncbi:MAG TPA: Mpo1-like protein [Terriglobales bacterium]|nr:Mpo1-like protein [Terriglobales bacterium]